MQRNQHSASISVGLSSLVCGLALVLGLAMAQATGAESAEPKLIRSVGNDGADAPSGRLLLRMPSAGNDATNEPAVEDSHPPAEPSEPVIEAGDSGATFFGESVGKEVVWVLDCSGSMQTLVLASMEDAEGNVMAAPTRIDVVKAEAIRTLRDVPADTRFDIIQLAGSAVDYGKSKAALPVTKQWQGSLIECTDTNREAAINFVRGMNTWFGTPTTTALETACTQYGGALNNIFFLTDGAPTWFDIPDIKSNNDLAIPFVKLHQMASDHILKTFPSMFALLKASGCDLVCIQIGSDAHSLKFVQKLAAENGGKFVHVAQ